MARTPRIRPLGINACCVSVPCTRAFVTRVCTNRFMTCHSPPRVLPATRETGSSVSPWTAGGLEGGPPAWAVPWPGRAPGQGLLFPSLLCPAYLCPPRKETGRETPVTLCVDWGSGERGQRQGGPGTCWWPHLHQLPGCRGEAPVVLELCPGNAHPPHLLFCLLSSLGLGVSLLCDCSCSASSWHKFAEPAPSFQ